MIEREGNKEYSVAEIKALLEGAEIPFNLHEPIRQLMVKLTNAEIHISALTLAKAKLDDDLLAAKRSISEERNAAGSLADAVGRALDRGMDDEALRAALSRWAQREAAPLPEAPKEGAK